MSGQVMMNRTTASHDALLWRSAWIDLGFWTVVGAVAATASEGLGALLGIPTQWLVTGGIGTLVLCIVLLWLIQRSRPLSSKLIWVFFISNAVGAPLAWIMALTGALPLTSAGNWALAIAGDVMLVLGIYQFYALRKFGK
jgi:hypothetical protein